jgi:hypothetical protein
MIGAVFPLRWAVAAVIGVPAVAGGVVAGLAHAGVMLAVCAVAVAIAGMVAGGGRRSPAEGGVVAVGRRW